MTDHYYSSGKLILTGEYLVLYGADALVLPLLFGQTMSVSEDAFSKQRSIRWTAKQNGNIWFSALIEPETFSILETNSLPVCKKLIKLFQVISRAQPERFARSLSFETNINFRRTWGFGTSSTLINNLASWANLDPFQLHFRV